jgi:Protein of unknown function (DUF3352)
MFGRNMRGPRKPKLGPQSPLAGDGRDSIGRRLRALRDIGPGSGSSRAWLDGLRSRAADGAWGRFSQTTRARILAGAIVVVVALLVWFVLVPAAPCSFPGGDRCPPRDDAIGLVPDDALAYAHLDIDAGTEQSGAARALSSRIPMLTDLITGGLVSASGLDADFSTRIAPWAGGEAAVALLPAGTAVGRVVMIEAEDPDAAEELASQLYGPRQSTTEAGGVEVSVGPRGGAWAIDDGFLVVGRDSVVTGMLETSSGDRLDSAEEAGVIDELPEDNLAYGYLSADGARALLAVRDLEPLDTFIDAAATTGAAAAVSADGDGFHLTLRSDLDPERAEESPGFFAAFPQFTPSLDAGIGVGSLAYLGLGDPASSAESLLAQARRSSPGLVAAFRRASKDLRKEAGLDITTDLLPILDSEIALSAQPVSVPADEQAPPGVVADSATPFVSLLADGVDTEEASRALAELQESVANALAPKSDGRVTVFEPIQVAGLQAQSLAVSPALNLTYATYDDRLVIATSPLGIQQARSIDDGLDTSPAFEQATEGMPDAVSLIAYVDLVGLLRLGEQVGLAIDPTYTALAPDLRTLNAVALAVDGGEDQITTDLNVVIGPRQEPEIDASPLGGD